MECLLEKAKKLRTMIFESICKSGGGHTPSAMSIVEILTTLYYRVMKIDPNNPSDPERDRFILSKGHACVALYSVLADKGYIDKKYLDNCGMRGSILGGHPDMLKIPGIEASTGALGHGFPFGVGMAFAAKLNKKKYRVFTLLGDGECQEGSVWEAAMFAPHHKLDNLVVIIDHNRLQAVDTLDNIISLKPLAEKWHAFGWEVREADGHDIQALLNLFNSLPFAINKPNLIIANTIKGKGISFMENKAIWHFRMPKENEIKIAYKELGIEKLDQG